MKLKFTLLVLFISIMGQAQNCTSVVSSSLFQQKFNQAASTASDQYKWDISVNFTNSNCLTSHQVKMFASLFSTDAYRLEYCKLAYTHTFDHQNFYDVYDAFATFSNAFRLHDYVTSVREAANEVLPPPPPPTEPDPVTNVSESFPDWNYPSVVGYTGITGCNVPMADSDFELLVKPVMDKTSDSERITAAKQLVATHCVSMAQGMKLASLVQMQSHRLDFMKDIFEGIYDQGNFAFAVEVFSHIPYQNDWLAYATVMLAPSPVIDPVVTCVVTDAQMDQIKKDINAQTWNEDKRKVLFGFLNAPTTCLSTTQIVWFMKYYPFDDDRQEVASAAYDSCTDKHSYANLKSNFTFSSSKVKFIKWLDAKN
ncbi:MAG: hypothetical protein COB65_13050 [Thalassobium sp.]|nr:MAG: hypothetical protein COB65_13050 [Thalassobium sp.]